MEITNKKYIRLMIWSIVFSITFSLPDFSSNVRTGRSKVEVEVRVRVRITVGVKVRVGVGIRVGVRVRVRIRNSFIAF